MLFVLAAEHELGVAEPLDEMQQLRERKCIEVERVDDITDDEDVALGAELGDEGLLRRNGRDVCACFRQMLQLLSALGHDRYYFGVIFQSLVSEESHRVDWFCFRFWLGLGC